MLKEVKNRSGIHMNKHEHHHLDNKELMKVDQHQKHSHHAGRTKEKTHDKHEGHSIADFKRRFIVSLILTIPILMLSHMFRELIGIGPLFMFEGDIYVLFILSSAIFFYGGYPFLKGIKDELARGKPGMMTLIAIAITVAYLYSSAVVFGVKGDILFWELATLIDIMLLGHWIEMRSIVRASHALDELVKLLPDIAHRISGNVNIEDVPLSEIKNNDRLLIKPGEKIPVDGEITEGTTSINESMITGEANPVSKSKGDLVIGGSINGEGSIKILVQKTGKETFLSQVIKLVKDAQESKSKTQNLADKAAFWLTITAVAGGIITFLGWMLFANESFNFALTRTVTVMVIACPHALGLAIPLVASVSTALSAKNGLLIKNRTAFEIARKINAVIFDKTGTLTEGEFGVADIVVFDENYSKDDVIKYGASVESESEHPIAKAVVKDAGEKYEVKNFHSIPGKGAEGDVNGKKVKVVSPGYLKENNIRIPGEEFSSEGKTVIYVIINDNLTGAIALADKIREESKAAVKELKSMGIKAIMITGDNRGAAEYVSRQIGIDEYFAGVLPGDKSTKIDEIRSRGFVTAMVGDGVNDAPALAKADVGIAIGAGTDVASETADIILVRNNPRDVVSLIKFARSTYKKMVQNLAWATGYNVIALPLAAGVLYYSGIVLSPAAGAVLMSLSTIIVAVNAKLLKI